MKCEKKGRLCSYIEKAWNLNNGLQCMLFVYQQMKESCHNMYVIVSSIQQPSQEKENKTCLKKMLSTKFNWETLCT